jgi:hypothetical protein
MCRGSRIGRVVVVSRHGIVAMLGIRQVRRVIGHPHARRAHARDSMIQKSVHVI